MSTDAAPEATLVTLRALADSGDVIDRAEGVRLAERAIAAHAEGTDPAVERTVACLRIERSRLLATLDHAADALAELDAVMSRFGDDALGAQALLARARLHQRSGRHDAALSDVAALIARFGTAGDAEARRAAAAGHLARIEWAMDAAEWSPDDMDLGCWAAIAADADAFVETHAGDADAGMAVLVARGMYQRARAWRTSRFEDEEDDSDASVAAQAATDALFARFGTSDDPAIRRWVAESETDQQGIVTSPDTVLALCDRALALSRAWGREPEDFFAASQLRRARALGRLRRQQETNDQLEELIATHGESSAREVQVTAAKAHEYLVRVLRQSAHDDDALIAFARFAAWMRRYPEASTHSDVRSAFLYASCSRIELLSARVDVEPATDTGLGGVSVNGTPPPPSQPLTPPEAVYADAVAELVSAYRNDPQVNLRGVAVDTLNALAYHQRLRGHFTEAEQSYRRLLADFGDDDSRTIREQTMASARMNLGFLLLTLMGRPADALAVYDDALRRIGQPTSPQMLSLVSRIQSSRSAALTLLYDRGVAVEGDGVDTLGSEERERIRTTTARANALADAGDFAGAVAEYDSVIDAHPAPQGPDLRRRVVNAMVRKGYCLGRLGRWSDSLAHHRAILALFDADLDMTVEKDVALAHGNLATALDHLGRHEEESDVYGRILARWKDSPVPYLIERCARAAWLKGYTDAQLGRDEDAERAYRTGMRYLGAQETAVRVEAAKSAVNLSLFLRKRARAAEAADTARRALDALAHASGQSVAEQRTWAQMALARAEAQRGQVEAARVAYDWLLNDRTSTITAEQRSTFTQEYIKLLGGPFKAAWDRIRRNFGKT